MPSPVTIPRSGTQDRGSRTWWGGMVKERAANQSKTHLSLAKQRRRSVRGLFRRIPGISPGKWQPPPWQHHTAQYQLPSTNYQLPTPNANRPDRESLVRRQAHWAGYTIIGCCCYCHHFIIVVVSSSAQVAAMNVVVLFLSPRRLLFAIVVAPELWSKGTAKAQSCSQSQSHCRRGAQRSRQASGGDRGIRRPSDIDDCQTPSELLASFVAASVSCLVGLQIANRSGIRWMRVKFMCF